jgi:hypothetical protein
MGADTMLEYENSAWVRYDYHQRIVAELQAEIETLKGRYAFDENQRLCVGYAGGCDGDLEATEHEENCPARKLDTGLRPHIYAPPSPAPEASHSEDGHAK